MDAETRFFGAWSRSVSLRFSGQAERLTYDDNTVAQVPHLCSLKSVSINLRRSLWHWTKLLLLSYLVHGCDPKKKRN